MKNIEQILNDCLNKALCQKGRIQQPSSNTIADFVSKYIQAEKLIITDVVKPFFCNNEKVGVRCTTQCLGCDGFEINE